MATNEWLLLRIPPQDDAPLTWVALDAAGQLLAPPADVQDPQLQAMAVGRRVALLVPGSDVAYFNVQLPAGNDARLLQLAPFALEDQVSEDLEELHFAIGSRDAASGMVPVAVVNRERMAGWQARAAALQLSPAAVYVESELAPTLPGHVTMTVCEEQLVLRQEDGLPLLMPASDPLFALGMLLGEEADPAAVHLAVYACAQEWPRHSESIEALRGQVASLNVQLDAGGPLALYARNIGAARPMNLLQGAFRPSAASQNTWERWRAVAIAMLVLVVLQISGSWWQLHRVRAEAAQLDKSMATLFTTVFPGQSPGADPYGQFQRRLAEVAGGSAQQGEFLPMLAAIAAAQQNVPMTRLESLGFKPGALQLRLSAPDSSTLEQFSQALRAGGYLVEILSGQSQGQNYSGQLTVKVQGS
jgi:general secretion pathway protein L